MALCFLIFPAGTFATSYYVDALLGNDNNTGTQEDPFRTIERVNALVLREGDSVSFAGGQTYNGTLRLKNLFGSKENPIVISSYGIERATLNGENGNAILADSCSGIQVKNLILNGNGRFSGNKGSGVEFRSTRNCVIDNIEVHGFFLSGVKVVGGKDLRITRVYAYNNGFSGINVESDGQDAGGLEGSGTKSFHNLYIGNCIAENNMGCPEVKDNHSGNGILIGGVTNGIIEYCEAMNNGWDMPREGNGPVGIWAYQSDSIIIQHCYSHDNKTSAKGKDGGGFDFDGGVTNSIMQFNFSANNEGAGYGLFQYYGASVWKNNIIRNNISYNDGSKNGRAGILLWIAEGTPDSMSNCLITNNIIVNRYGHSVRFEPGYYPNFRFENNIFVLTRNPKSFVLGEYTGASFRGNNIWVENGELQLAFPEDTQAECIDPKIRIPVNAIELPKSVDEMMKMDLFK